TEIQAYLDGHNKARAAHGAQSLTWSDELADKAKHWAEKCEFKHTDGAFGLLGENLTAGAGIYTPDSAISRFSGESYDPQHPIFNHFTQVVWKSTTQLGCAAALCDNFFDKKFGPATYHVCFYNPVGNVIGQ
ncbi:PR-1-like protein, partial [Panus rudis PR-1116 ss-1]